MIRANQFILEDETGNVRAGLIVGKNGSALVMCDETGEGRLVAALAMLKNGPGLILLDETGKKIWSQP